MMCFVFVFLYTLWSCTAPALYNPTFMIAHILVCQEMTTTKKRTRAETAGSKCSACCSQVHREKTWLGQKGTGKPMRIYCS